MFKLSEMYAKAYNNQFGQTVYEHCLTVGIVAKNICQYKNFTNYSNNYIGFICSLHDIGKISPAFQYTIYNAAKQVFPLDLKKDVDNYNDKTNYHAGISTLFVQNNNELKNTNIDKIIDRHHGYSSNFIFNKNLTSFINKQIYKEFCNYENLNDLRNELFNELKKYFDIKEFTKIEENDLDLISGILSISDWIGSGQLSDLVNIDENIIKDKVYNLFNNIKLNFKQNLSFKDIFGFTPYESQQSIIDKIDDYGFYIIEEETGKGKTETALMTAYNFISSNKCNGLVFALPTQVTSNKIFERVNKFLNIVSNNKIDSKLIHSNSSIYLSSIEKKENEGFEWINQKNTELLYPIITCTVDQILKSILNYKFNFVKEFSLYNKVIIIDEIHSYDIYTANLINKLKDVCTNYSIKSLIVFSMRIEVFLHRISN